MGRSDDTRQRRREILDAALDCFGAYGYEKTTLAEIRDRSGASIGSIYHHFGGKESIFAALYLDAIADSQASALRSLRRAEGLEQGVRGLVRSYLRWVERHRALAAFLLTMRRAEFMASAEDELAALNRAFHEALLGGLDASGAGRLELPLDLLLALWVGPSEEFARRWLRGRTTTPIRQAADVLADAAWVSLLHLRGGR